MPIFWWTFVIFTLFFFSFFYIETCKHNRIVAESFGRNELTEVWYIAEVIATSITTMIEESDPETSSCPNPFNKSILESL